MIFFITCKNNDPADPTVDGRPDTANASYPVVIFANGVKWAYTIDELYLSADLTNESFELEVENFDSYAYMEYLDAGANSLFYIEFYLG